MMMMIYHRGAHGVESTRKGYGHLKIFLVSTSQLFSKLVVLNIILAINIHVHVYVYHVNPHA